ncbi:MAG TPA: hypothetical protein VJN94_12145 [Candidatus Binataceae bacterium]|nr:hypothetical protein [Candidatus Binataceae bacterium]
MVESLEQLHDRLRSIEQSLDTHGYRPGPWESLVRALRSRPAAERAALAGDVSRVSRKLHQRQPRKTYPIPAAIALEVALAILGPVMLAISVRLHSNLLAIAGAGVWMTAIEPLLKYVVGRLLGVGYDYAYLFRNLEPRLKMDYGSYLAASRSTRICLQLSGMVGSPLAAWRSAVILPATLAIGRRVCWIAFAVVTAINLGTLIIGLAGIRKLGSFRINDSSAGAAAIEIREALGLNS